MFFFRTPNRGTSYFTTGFHSYITLRWPVSYYFASGSGGKALRRGGVSICAHPPNARLPSFRNASAVDRPDRSMFLGGFSIAQKHVGRGGRNAPAVDWRTNFLVPSSLYSPASPSSYLMLSSYFLGTDGGADASFLRCKRYALFYVSGLSNSHAHSDT